MSVVHDNLKRDLEERTALSDTPADPVPETTDPHDDLRRKQQRLIEGIRHLQQTVQSLTAQLEDAREDNRQLRDLVRTQAGPARDAAHLTPQSLISQAME